MKFPVLRCLITGLVLVATCTLADEPVKVISDAEPNAGIFENATRNKPLVLRSNAEATAHFGKQELAKLQTQVDFNKQIVLVFAWRGSGQDRLTFDVAESNPEQVRFNYRPGRTRDLRPHVHVFALRSNVLWRAPGGAAGGGAAADAAEEYVNVELQGKLNSQVMAIGGETTGVTVTANGLTLELEFGDRQPLRRAAEELHGKLVVVKGSLSVKQGIEIRQRWIVNVKSLLDANAKTDSTENPRKRK